MIDGIQKGLIEPLLKQQDDLLAQKLHGVFIDAGSLEALLNRRFPRICRVICGEWSYWFYDDGSKNGRFLVAFSEIKLDPPIDNSVRAYYQTKDTYNGEVDIL